MNYPIILLVSAGAGIVAAALTSGGIVWRGIFVIGRWFGETTKTLAGLSDKMERVGSEVGIHSIQLARLDERFDALESRLDRGGL